MDDDSWLMQFNKESSDIFAHFWISAATPRAIKVKLQNSNLSYVKGNKM